MIGTYLILGVIVGVIVAMVAWLVYLEATVEGTTHD